ncbi:SMP-30/gluconolactonase/LRE family protein [Halomonas sp. MCCC 1A11036]|uniref:SMP-30/gluconolactonase/LRE family protein n=1 Tax=Billgrantia zhangzhouensis TaxID=2733481 RepID=A0ABS9ABU3_9GAMM|nr:SMP-30/gluconolactonase/LRE family protein [Halomonas zhangzhouensis]MCE8019386.1 SMP-30/gluconolactonase/LRE family protein [Halomonas zhangzhouensis]
MVDGSMIQCVWRGRAQLGEGPLWCAERGEAGQLLFVDILGRTLHVHDFASGRTRSWPLDEACCWLAPRADGDGFIAGLASRLVHLRLDENGPRIVDAWATPEEPAGNRFNDAAVDAQGRLWFGSMRENEKESGEPGQGAFYRLDAAGLRRVDHGYGVANGPAISPDGRTLYHSDTVAGIVYAFDLSLEGGLSGKREHLRFHGAQGYPDGMTCDVEGGLWVAHWGGGRVSRFLPDGTLDETLILPASRVTSCAFGGPELDQLYITTAADGREQEALAGSLFRVAPGIRGLSSPMFAA